MTENSRKTKTSDRIISFAGGVLSLLACAVAVLFIIYSGYVFYDNFYIQNQAFSTGSELKLYKPVIIEDDGTPLVNAGSSFSAVSDDYRAWLTVYDTNIDYPVMQTDNDLYYASHDPYGEASLTGSLYLAAANTPDFSDTYNLIYGHHMDNSALFGELDWFRDESYFYGHREGMLITNDKIYDLYTFAVLDTDAYEDMIYNPGNVDLEALLDFIREGSSIWDGDIAGETEQIIAFSTCASASTNGRLVVFARMTERASDIVSEEEELEEIIDDPVTKTSPKNFFDPAGSVYGTRAWALVNLICLVMTFYILIPLLRIRDKVIRPRFMHKANEEQQEAVQTPETPSSDGKEQDEGKGRERRFRIKLIIGFALEIIICAGAVIAFILTENVRLPMTLIDRWTPLMILLMIICWVVDIIFIRHKKMEEQKTEDVNNPPPIEAGACKSSD